MMKVFFLCCTMVVVLCFPVFAEGILVVYADKGYMPYYSADATQGIYIEFLEKFEEHHPQFSFVFKLYPRKRMSFMMQNGAAHVLALNSPVFSDTEKYLFTETIWKEASVIFMRKNDVFSFKEPSDLFNKRVGIISGNHYPVLEPYFRNGEIKLHGVGTSIQLFKLLRAKRIEAFVGDKHVTLYRLKQEGYEGEFKYASNTLFEFDLSIQVQKTYQHLVDAMNQFIRESKDNGFLHSLE